MVNVKTVVTFSAVCALLVSCHSQVTGSPGAASIAPSGDAPASATPTPLAGVSPPTTAAPNPKITSTTFDGCASVTDAEAASWGVDPAQKHDSADGTTAGWSGSRGCYWQGAKWDVRVYATNGSLAKFEEPDEDHDRKERVQFGDRQGLIAHKAPPFAGCSAFVTSQQGIAAVQIVPGIDIQDAHIDVCPDAIRMMNTIVSRIP